MDTGVSLVCYFGCKALGLWLVLYFFEIYFFFVPVTVCASGSFAYPLP